MFTYHCSSCGSQVESHCPAHPSASVESIGVSDTNDDRICAILARVEPEFDNPHYDPNLAELCRSALRGNAEHKAWVLEATIETAAALYDSNTAERVTANDLGITAEQYAEAIAESLDCPQIEGHVRLENGRRVYAQ